MDGESVGLEEGLSDGDFDGTSDGIRKGLSEGKVHGLPDGYSDLVAEGFCEVDGCVLGSDEGAVDVEGPDDGSKLGLDEGFPNGETVG